MLIDEVLALLKKNQGEYLSGEALAASLRVSREAVWKAVNTLRARGHDIKSAHRRGYCLSGGPDLLNASLLDALVKEGGQQMDVLVFRTTDSTNNEGRRRALGLTRPLLIAADCQTAGRGRGDHSFYSPDRTGLYLTVVCPTRLALADAALATQAMAVAAARAAEALGAPPVRVKWVNDLYVHGKKAAGILTEAVSDLESGTAAAVICGIGLNLTTADFPADVRPLAGDLGPLDRHRLAAQIACRFLELFALLPQTDAWLPEYRARSLALGAPLTFTRGGRFYRATGEDIDGRGRLIVCTEDGERLSLDSGEISIRLDPGREDEG